MSRNRFCLALLLPWTYHQHHNRRLITPPPRSFFLEYKRFQQFNAIGERPSISVIFSSSTLNSSPMCSTIVGKMYHGLTVDAIPSEVYCLITILIYSRNTSCQQWNAIGEKSPYWICLGHKQQCHWSVLSYTHYDPHGKNDTNRKKTLNYRFDNIWNKCKRLYQPSFSVEMKGCWNQEAGPEWSNTWRTSPLNGAINYKFYFWSIIRLTYNLLTYNLLTWNIRTITP